MPIASEALVCPRCKSPIAAALANQDQASCANCNAPLAVVVFPAFFPKSDAAAGASALSEEGEASCFYHPLKRAVVPCDQCGRFLCGLCQVEFLGQNWCPGCVESRRQKGQLAVLDSRRPLYDNLVLTLAIAPALLIWPTIISAPMTLYLTGHYWRVPSSILPRTKIRFWIGATLAFLEIALWVWLVLYLIYRL